MITLDATAVERVHEPHELGGGTVAAGRREVAEGLVAPGGVVGMLRDRHELHVGEAHLAHVVGELLGQLPVARERAGLGPPPRAQVHLVDRHGAVERAAPLALVHPLRVAPGEPVELDDRRGGARVVRLEGEGHRIRFQREQPTVPPDDLVLVAGAQRHVGNKDLPDAVTRVQAHGLRPPIPAVPVADHADPPGVGCPHREAHAVHALVTKRVSPESLEEAEVRALAEQVQVVAAERGREPIGILDLGHASLIVREAQAVGEGQGASPGQLALPEAPGMCQAQRGDRAVGREDRGRARRGQEGADVDRAVTAQVRAQDREGVAVLPGDDGVHDIGGKRCERHRLVGPAPLAGDRASGVV
jgi:hypothetical protein